MTILFTNDAHTHVDNRTGRGLRYSQIAWLKKACAEREPTFLVDAGDYLQGTAYGAFDGGEQIVGLMNAAGYDVATVGNHEFDFHATNLQARVRQAKFPIVSCNAWRRTAAEGEKTPAFAAYAVLTNTGVRRHRGGLRRLLETELAMARCEFGKLKGYYEELDMKSPLYLAGVTNCVVGALGRGDLKLFDRILKDLRRYPEVNRHPQAQLGREITEAWIRQFLRVPKGHPEWMVRMNRALGVSHLRAHRLRTYLP